MGRFFKADRDFLRYQKMARTQQITEKQMIRHCWSLIQKKLATNYGFAEGKLWSPNQPLPAASRRPVLAPDFPVLSHAPAANETLQPDQATERQAPEEPETGRAGWCKKCTIL